MQINALLSGFSPVALRAGERPFPPVAGEAESRVRQESVPVDVFEQGQPWKNLATGSGAGVAGGKSAGGKRYPAFALQAYAKQAGGQENISMPAVVAVEKEEKSGEASGVTGQGTAIVSRGQQDDGQGNAEPAKEKTRGATGPKGPDGEALTQAQQLQVAELEVIDTKVRAHELAHLAAAGSYATGGASFQYAKGPDGKQYAVGGEVGIDTGKESSPEATISKMQTVRAAALAPADPSPQDQKVAARASLVISEVSQELQMTRLEQSKGQREAKQTAQVQAESGGKASPEQGKETSVPEDQAQAQEGPFQQKSPTNTQKAAAATVAGFTRQASSIHIAV
jgi:hypothetical protein